MIDCLRFGEIREVASLMGTEMHQDRQGFLPLGNIA